MGNANGWGDGSVNNNIGWGQGAINNNISWGKSQLTSWSGATDIDGGNAPTNTVAPALSGTAQEGQTLTCSTGTWTGSPTYTYQWKRNGSNITSATNSTYTLVTADVGQSIKCTVTATNAVGSASADSNTVTPTASTDADAQAFITAASITDPTQQSAINTLVTDLKGYGIWTKFKAIYPIVGGTAATHKWNLKDPRDLDAAFRLTFSSGWSHSSTGMTPTNAYAQTNFATTNLNNDSNHLSYYSRTQNSSTNSIAIGNDWGPGDQLYMSLYYAAVSLKFFLTGNYGSNERASVNISNTLGFHIGTQTAINLRKLYFAGNLVATNTNSRSITRNANGIYLGALNSGGTALLFTPHQCAFASIGDGLTDTEAANFYTAVQAFQTTLSRQV